jgi:DNA-binding transcriptional ArsR family regulator
MADDQDRVWKALSDPTRRRILDLLNQSPRTTSDLSASFQLSRFAVMKHLAVLEEAGLISVRRSGRERWNHLNADPLSRIYSRWFSQNTAWAPTLEGQNASSTPEAGRADEPEPEPLKELFIVVRPEEKYAVERALQSVMPTLYDSIHAVGRGGHQRGSSRPWQKKKQLEAFLPKTMFVLVVPESYVGPILRAVSAALRLEGGPDDCGVGFATVAPIGEEIVIGVAPNAPSHERARAEGWAG